MTVREKYLERQRRYNASEKGRERGLRYNHSERGNAKRRELAGRRIRMRAGGIQFHLGYAPTVEHAKVFRESLNRLPKGKSW